MGLNQNVVNRVMAIAEREAFVEGELLLRSGDAARYLFILAQGEVKITIAETGKQVYTGRRVGGAFGWSSLIDLGHYGGDAICATPVFQTFVPGLGWSVDAGLPADGSCQYRSFWEM